MFFNPRYPVILFILSFMGVMLGLVLKILHWPGGSFTIGAMIMVQAIAIAWLIVVIIKSKKQP